jgi:serine/threonine-protein kinase
MKKLIFMLMILSCCLCFGVALAANKPAKGEKAAAKTIIVSAEGLADPDAAIYRNDKGLLLDDLRADARRQVIEKAVGTLVESSTLVENFALIEDKVLTQSQGLIKQVIKESDPWLGEDGFMHILLKAEVYLSDIQESLKEMSRTQRVSLIKEQGNPRISVAVRVKDAERGSEVPPERSEIAENILKKGISAFGYRVWSEPESGSVKDAQADFAISGEAKFKKNTVRLAASGLNVSKYVLTSWTVKCLNVLTGEEIYFNNQVPQKKSWNDEDVALADIGALIAAEFNKDFFEQHLLSPSRIFQLHVHGLPDYDTGNLLKKELLGLRHVLNLEFRDFQAGKASLFEVDYSGSRENFAQSVNTSLIGPLNEKFQTTAFAIESAKGDAVSVRFKAAGSTEQVADAFNKFPPASLYEAAPGRFDDLIKDDSTREKIRKLAPELGAQLEVQPTAATGAAKAAASF